jgi:transcription initiation factor TFIIIB Brf1 subunit/transcription initiation factor TFIIB
MLKVNVGARNRATPCQRCGRRLGDVGKHAFLTSRGRAFCSDCGLMLEDSTVTIESVHERRRQHVDGKGFVCHNETLTSNPEMRQSLNTGSGQSPRDFSCCLSRRRHTWRALSRKEIVERCKNLSMEIRRRAENE